MLTELLTKLVSSLTALVFLLGGNPSIASQSQINPSQGKVLGVSTPALVQHVSGFNYSSNLSVSLSNVQAGDLLVAYVRGGGSTAPSVSDSANGSWTQAALVSGTQVGIYYKQNSVAGPLVVTVNLSGSGSSALQVSEFSGVDTVSPLDTSATASGYGGASPSVTLSTSADGDLIFGGLFIANSSGSSDLSFAGIDGSGTDTTQYTVQSTHSSLTVPFTNGNPSNGSWYALAAAFKATGAATGGTTVQPPLVSDITPPVISGISTSDITNNSASVSWSTDEISDSQVEYGTTVSYGSASALNSSSVVSHNISLTGLSASTLYHYRVKSRDAAGNIAISTDNTFTSSAASVQTVSSGLGWSELPNTMLKPVCPPNGFGGAVDPSGAPYPFSTNCKSVIGAWSGGILDTLRNRMIIWGGGHGDYSGNEVYSLNLGSTPSMTRLNNPSVPINEPNDPNCLSALADGNPNSRHSYGALVYIQHADKMFAFGGSLACGTGQNNSDTWTLDLATLKWKRMDPTNGTSLPTSYYTGPSVLADYDPNSKLVYVTNSGGAFWSYNYDTNTYTLLSGNLSLPLNTYGVIDTKRKLFVFMGPGYGLEGTPKIEAVSIAPGSNYVLQDWTSQVTGCDALASVDYPGLTYDPVLDRIVGWPNFGNTVYLFNPDTKSCTAQTYAGGPKDSTDYLGNPFSSGTFNRLRYVPALNAEVLVNFWTNNAYVLRLSSTAPVADTASPTIPTNLSATAISSTQINLSWTASSDNIGVVGYKIYRNGSQVSTSATPNYSDTGLLASTAYTYTVAAYDAAGNVSLQSSPAIASTQAAVVTTGSASLGKGCTTGYYIDKDCDGYGVGVRSDSNYSGINVGDRADADDNDSAVNTPASWQSKYGSLTALLQAKGYNPSRIAYVSPNGNDATGQLNDINKPFQHIGALGTIFNDGLGGAIIYRGGTYTDRPIDSCYTYSYPCFEPHGVSAASPMIIMAYPGESVILKNAGYMSFFWPHMNYGYLVVDGLNIQSSSPNYGYGLNFGDSIGIVLRNNEYVNYQQGVFLGVHTRNALVENSVFHDNDEHSFYLGGSVMPHGSGAFDFAQDAINYNNRTSDGSSKDVTFKNNLIYRDGGGGYGPVHINSYATNVNVEGNIIHDSGNGIDFQSGIYNSTIKNNLLFNNGGTAIIFYLYDDGVQNIAATLENNTVVNNTIWMGDSFNETTGQSTYIRGTSVAGGFVARDNSTISPGTHWIKNNTIENNVIITDNFSQTYGRIPISFWAHSYPNTHTIQNNIFWSNSASPNSATDRVMNISLDAYPNGQDAGNYNMSQFQAYSSNFRNNLYADPKVTSASQAISSTPEKFNFALLSGSPAINYGITAGAPSTDLKGSIRDSQPDIGAYEYNGSSANLSLPSISSFSASPVSIAPGQSATLSWSAANATSLTIDQSVGSVTGLTSKTVYPSVSTTYTLTATNSSGSVTRTVTVAVQALQAPVISNLVGSQTTSSSTRISWDTNVLTNGRVLYGLTSSYGLQSDLLDDLSKTLSHATTLTNLTPATLYHFKAVSTDANNQSVSSPDFTFTTLGIVQGDTTAPTISAVAAGSITTSGTTVTWTTNEASDSQVEYGPTASYGLSTPLNSTLSTSHVVALANLSANTAYHYRIKSKDAAGNLSVSADYTFVTQAPLDTAPPVLSGVSVNSITPTSAVITWTTNEPSDSQVRYGLSSSYGLVTSVDSSLVTSHTVSLSGLTSGTLYHFQALSKDAAANPSQSLDQTFITSAQVSQDTTPPVISSVQTAAKASTVSISWVTNEPSTSQVEYGPTAAYGRSSSFNATLSTIHKVNISGLSKNTSYHYRIKSQDAAGNLKISDDSVFTTSRKSSIINLQAGNGSVILSWQLENTQNVTGIKIVRSTSSSPLDPSEGTVLADLPPTATTYTDTAVTAGINYYYSLFSYYNKNGTVLDEPTSISFTPASKVKSAGGSFDTPSGVVVYIPSAKNAASSAQISLPPLTRDLAVNSNHPEVLILQKILISLNFLDPDSATSYFGPVTKAAVQAFQKKYAIISSGPSYGKVGPATRAKLNSLLASSQSTQTGQTSSTKVMLTRTLYVGSKGADVALLQDFLVSNGYLSAGNNTGYYGQLTRSAVKNFQCQTMQICSGSEATTGWGMVGQRTRAKLGELKI